MIISTALSYWEIMKRYNFNKANPMMPGQAVRQLKNLRPDSTALQRRVNAFVNRHRVGSPSDGGGPQHA